MRIIPASALQFLWVVGVAWDSSERKGKIGLAPMEGVIDVTTRALLSEIGGLDWIVTEFVRVVDQRLPAKVFHRLCPELQHDAMTPNKTPVHLQLLGSDPIALGENAEQARACGATHIDINFGCPAKLVNRRGGGASLLRIPASVEAATNGVASAINGQIPVSAKLRLGFDDKQLALACAEAAVAGGAQWLTVHARTRKEGYRPPAHWEWISRIREHVRVPVVANGDIWTLEDYWQARALSGCTDVMIGRGLLADPWLARRIKQWQRHGTRLPDTTWSQRASVLTEFVQRLQSHLPDKVVLSLVKQWLNIMRQHDQDTRERFVALRSAQSVSSLLSLL